MIEIIPAIDVISGRCVRLTKGEYSSQKIYNEDPLEVAYMLENAGCRRLHIVDLDGAKSGHVVNYKVLENIASHTGFAIDFGGGLKSDEDLHIAFESGAAMVTGGSVAVKSKDLFRSWLLKYGGDKIILGADVRNGKIATTGWTESGNEEIVPFIKSYVGDGIKMVISTDIDKDGMLGGASVDLYSMLIEEFPEIKVIASGGIGSMVDIENLAKAGVPAVIVGKAIYENRITMKDLERINLG